MQTAAGNTRQAMTANCELMDPLRRVLCFAPLYIRAHVLQSLCMFVFKILLIILISAPVIAFAWIMYGQVLLYIRERNRVDKERMRGR